MKITDALITTLLKLGAVGEMRGFKTDVVVPGESGSEPIKITITAESLKISMNNKGD
jgi:hypothetical protein